MTKNQMINFQWYAFAALSTNQLYSALALRAAVFVVEQQCPYQDLDGKDQQALHLLGMANDSLVAYLRLFPPTAITPHLIFGRVVTAPSSRKLGYGKQLINTLLNYCEMHFPGVPIHCSAQFYLKNFYESFGFSAYGSIYAEDNIPHIGMKKEYNNSVF